jgi:hypothetical protein
MKRFRKARSNLGVNIVLLLLIAGAIAACYFVFKYLATEVFDVNSLVETEKQVTPMQMSIFRSVDVLRTSVSHVLQ